MYRKRKHLADYLHLIKVFWFNFVKFLNIFSRKMKWLIIILPAKQIVASLMLD
jgi:hypothetical protein